MAAKPTNPSSSTGRQSIGPICSFGRKEEMRISQECQEECECRLFLSIPSGALQSQFGITSTYTIYSLAPTLLRRKLPLWNPAPTLASSLTYSRRAEEICISIQWNSLIGSEIRDFGFKSLFHQQVQQVAHPLWAYISDSIKKGWGRFSI